MEDGWVGPSPFARQGLGTLLAVKALRPVTDDWVEPQGMDLQSMTGPRGLELQPTLRTWASWPNIRWVTRPLLGTHLWIGHSLTRPVLVNSKRPFKYKTPAASSPFTFPARTVASDEMSCETAALGPVGSCDDLAGHQPRKDRKHAFSFQLLVHLGSTLTGVTPGTPRVTTTPPPGG